MAEVKVKRTKKKQLGQFMTPLFRCQYIISSITLQKSDKVLEPSFGCGNFIITLIEKFLPHYEGTIYQKLDIILTENIWGIEFDEEQYNLCLENIKNKWGYLPQKHNLVLSDYFLWETSIKFDWIIGNPPFGGTLNPKYQDEWDKKWGWRCGQKIKKETYSFFMIKSVELLTSNGNLIFISSDTFLTIKTMKGLRMFLFSEGMNTIQKLENFSEETDYPMIVLTHNRGLKSDHIILNDVVIPGENMKKTDNFSWNIDNQYAKYFTGDKLSKYLIASSGMTIGKNELFLKEIRDDNTIIEEYEYSFFDDPITLEVEYKKARNGKISAAKVSQIQKLEQDGKTRRNVRITKRDEPIVIQLPHPDYRFYNKASNEILFAKPNTVVFWKDDGDAVITYKKNGPWYLHGVGGKPFFLKEGLTWQLISSSIKAKYLPEGYILDSGAPIAVLKSGIEKRELLFIIGWLLTTKCNEILKGVINHTKNIQSKDIERLPYPFWVSDDDKSKIIDIVKKSINHKKSTNSIHEDFNNLELLFQFSNI
jgi:tRNA1(Val) A37 N6-methylase TrmN6